MKNTSWVWKEIRREKSAKIVLLAISFSFLVTILMFIVSGTFIKNVQKQTEDIYGYFDHILYHAEQNTDNLSFSQKKISKKYQPYVKESGQSHYLIMKKIKKILFLDMLIRMQRHWEIFIY